ncbi:MAG: hypothetical protein SO294_09185, partial [Prevotella sp.]|nr:hypothetical protein [Prevotella sp.]
LQGERRNWQAAKINAASLHERRFCGVLHFSEKFLRLFSFNRKYSVFLRPDYRPFYPCLVVGKRFFLPWPALANGNGSIPRLNLNATLNYLCICTYI